MSRTFLGLFSAALVYGFQQTGIEVTDAGAQHSIEIVLQLASLVYAGWGRWRKGDVNIFGMRK